MKVEIWSDYVCPFCYIGKHKFEEALYKFANRSDVTVSYKSYQLDPNTPGNTHLNYYENLAKKFGSLEQAKQMTGSIVEQAKQAGLDFNFDIAKIANTFDAHRLNKLAETVGKGQVVTEKLLRAHFTDGKHIGDKEVLTEIAVEAGLNEADVIAMLENKDAYKDAVSADIEEASKLGVTGVPFFIFNRKYAVSGAQPVEAFTQALEKVWEEENSASPLQDISSTTESDNSCGDDGCTI